MTATFAFDVCSGLGGYGSYGCDGDRGRRGPEPLDDRLASFDAEQRMAFGATAVRQFVQMPASNAEESEVRDPYGRHLAGAHPLDVR